MKNWQTITVGEYQHLMKLIYSDMDEFDKEINICACLSGKTPTDIEALDFGDYVELKKRLSWVYSTPPKSEPRKYWKRYRFIYDIRKINTGRYISLQTFLGGGIVEQLPNLAACIIKPRWGMYDATNHEQYAADIMEAPFILVYSNLLFFCELFTNFIQASLPEANSPEMQKVLTHLKSNLDGLFIANGSRSTSDAH